MRHLIVAAHPKASSFNRSVVDVFAAALAESGDQVVTRDLYALGFDPLLSARDLDGIRRGRLARDVRAEQAMIRCADALTLIAPIWWSGFPAMLKGYVDRVFSEGFAYTVRGGTYYPGLSGKQGAIITTSGASPQELRSAGTLRALKTIWDDGLLGFCGIEMVGHLYLGGIMPGMNKEQGKRRLDSVRRFARHSFRSVEARRRA